MLRTSSSNGPRVAVERLECVVEVFVPVIDANACVDVAKIKADDRDEQTPGGPFLFTCPIGFGDPPGVADSISLSVYD
jgi:hypothetical protein